MLHDSRIGTNNDAVSYTAHAQPVRSLPPAPAAVILAHIATQWAERIQIEMLDTRKTQWKKERRMSNFEAKHTQKVSTSPPSYGVRPWLQEVVQYHQVTRLEI